MKHSQKLLDHFIGAYEAYSDDIFRFCIVHGRDREKALDITQTTFLKTWEYLQKGNEIGHMRGFLYKTARNLLVDHSRKKQMLSLDVIFESGLDFHHENSIQQEVESRFNLESIISILDRLDEIHREVLYLRYIEDLTIKEIASILKQTENVISVRIHRGTKKLQDLLDDKDIL